MPVHYVTMQNAFNTTDCKYTNAELQWFSFESLFTTLTRLLTNIYCVNALWKFTFKRICWVKVGNILLYEKIKDLRLLIYNRKY